MRTNTKNQISFMTECAIMIAFAVICSFIKVYEMPQGGSVALTMIPIFIISIRRGALAGILTGAIYGIISMFMAGVIYHPMSILLDYVLAFAIVGICGLFKRNTFGIILGIVSGVAGRFTSSLISGAVLFAEYAPEGQNPWIYSLIYQATYLIPELIISLVIVLILYNKANRLFKI